MATGARVEEDVAAAAGLLGSLGASPPKPQVLLADHHTTVRFGGAVAKVRRAGPGSADAATMAREVAVARHLARAGAPVATPSEVLPPGPHFVDGRAISLWRHVEGRALTGADAVDAGHALAVIHRALASLAEPLPPMTDALDGCVATLRDATAAPRLAADDRAFLLAEHRRLRAAYDAAAFAPVPLHGDARLANCLVTDAGVVWLDFEAACIGPRERDLTQFSDAALHRLGPVDWPLLELLRTLGSACVATWCWADPDPTPTVREAAEHHLARLRRLAAR